MRLFGWNISRSIALAALAPLLIVAVSAGRFSQFRCLMTGLASESPCCPGLMAAAAHDGAERTAPSDVLAAEDCCSREDVEIARVPATAASTSASVPATAGSDDAGVPATHLSPIVVTVPAPGRVVAHAAAFQPPRPPLLLTKRSLLI